MNEEREKDSGASRCSARFVHRPDHDWGFIKDTKLDSWIKVVGYVDDDVAAQCRWDGTDPHQDQINELLNILNSKQND